MGVGVRVAGPGLPVPLTVEVVKGVRVRVGTTGVAVGGWEAEALAEEVGKPGVEVGVPLPPPPSPPAPAG